MIRNYPHVSLMLAFLPLYSILFFIPNLIALHSLQGAAQESSANKRNHLALFWFLSVVSSPVVCVHVCHHSTTVWIGEYFSIGISNVTAIISPPGCFQFCIVCLGRLTMQGMTQSVIFGQWWLLSLHFWQGENSMVVGFPELFFC